jgi:hypothetical protein
MKWSTLSVVCVALASLPPIPFANGGSITLKISESGAAGAGQGQLLINFQTDPTNGGIGLTNEALTITNGETAIQIATGLMNQVNNDFSVNQFYTATAGTQTDLLGDGQTVTFQTVTITPMTGSDGHGQDFTAGSISIPQGATVPPGVVLDPVVDSTAMATAQLQLVSTGTPNPSATTDWSLGVVNQSNEVIATSTLLNEPDTVANSTLIAMFSSDLLSQGIPVVASGNTLSLTSDDNDSFVITQFSSTFGGGKQFPLIRDATLPEPSSLTLLVIGVFGALGCASRGVLRQSGCAGADRRPLRAARMDQLR